MCSWKHITRPEYFNSYITINSLSQMNWHKSWFLKQLSDIIFNNTFLDTCAFSSWWNNNLIQTFGLYFLREPRCHSESQRAAWIWQRARKRMWKVSSYDRYVAWGSVALYLHSESLRHRLPRQLDEIRL